MNAAVIHRFYRKDIVEALRCELVAQGETDIPAAKDCDIRVMPARNGRSFCIALVERK